MSDDPRAPGSSDDIDSLGAAPTRAVGGSGKGGVRRRLPIPRPGRGRRPLARVVVLVGLAVARALAMAGQEVIVLEQHDLIGSETSSRNSEVIHAGLYYPTGSLRARLCVAGKTMLYRFCDDNGVTYRRCGKLLVAPFSVRPLPGAPVSMPLEWSEVREGLTPRQFTMSNAVPRLQALGHDPLIGVLKEKPDLLSALGKLGERVG